MTRHQIEKPWEAPPSRLAVKLQSWGIMAVALLLLLLVLTPLFWMILTAFKTPGTAFRLEFIPSRSVYEPPLNRPAIPLVSAAEGRAYVHRIIDNPRAAEASLVVRVPGAEGAEPTETVVAMSRTEAGLWVGVAGPFEPGITAMVGVGTDGSEPTFEEVTLEAGVSSNDERFFIYAIGDAGRATVRDEAGLRLSLHFGESRQIALRESTEQKGLYTAEFPAKGIEGYRLVRHRSFGEAVGSLYTLSNFKDIVASESFNFSRYFMNSLVVATGAGLITVLICTLAGYAFAQKQFHYREELFILLVSSMLVPGMIYMVPQFSIVLGLGWMNSYQGMIAPHVANVFGLFLLRQYIGQIPRDLFNAAEIDGANEVQVFTNIVIPVCLPIMVTLFLLTFVTQWSNFLWQLIINTGDSPYITLPVGLQQFRGQNATDWERIMAGACFSIIPIAVLFLSLQKYFLEGLTAGSVKE